MWDAPGPALAPDHRTNGTTMTAPLEASARLRRAGATALAAVLVLVAPSAAWALPSPDHGPTAGGTLVAGPLPERTDLVLSPVGGGSSGSHTVLLDPDGAAVAWGDNVAGQLGDGTTTSTSRPVRVLAPAGVSFTQVATGEDHTVAVGSDGATYAWGSNANGQLGDGTTADSSVPVRVLTPAGVELTAVAAGAEFTVATASDGTLYAWGRNSWGQLGTGTTENAASPVAVTMPAGVTFSGVSLGTGVAYAVGSDGVTYAWGSNTRGQLGTGNLTASRVPVPVRTPVGVTFARVVAGSTHGLGLTADGDAYAWGSNAFGMLGDGTTTDRWSPVPVALPAGVRGLSASAGQYHSVLIGSDGLTYAWGAGSVVGHGTTGDSPTPALVRTPSGVTFTHVAAGLRHTVAQGSDGLTYTWGQNTVGQLGEQAGPDGSTVPVALRPEPLVTQVAFGGVPGTDLRQDAAGWTVTTPAGLCGPVDVTVTSRLLDVTTTTSANAFTAGTSPTVTLQPAAPPAAGTGTEVRLVAAAEGDPAPTVQWQRSAPGSDWADVVGATSEELAARVEDETRLRAVFTSCAGSVTSDVVELAGLPLPGAVPATTADTAATPGTVDPAPDGDGALATTGAPVLAWAVGGLVLVLAGSLLVRAQRLRG